MVLTVRKLRCTNNEILKKRLHLKLASCVNIVLALFFQQNGAPVDYTNKETETELLDSLVQSSHTCKKRVIPVIYHRNFFWIFRKILG